MPRFAANLSMLFTELPFMQRFEAAAAAGFEAVGLGDGVGRAVALTLVSPAASSAVGGVDDPPQAPRVSAATRMTIGTKIPEMRSARRCTSALPV